MSSRSSAALSAHRTISASTAVSPCCRASSSRPWSRRGSAAGTAGRSPPRQAPARRRRLPRGGGAPPALIDGRGWAADVSVGNDTVALLRAGTERGWGVAVVCGAGINCIGVAPDGRQARFPALGDITGDWGGGHDVGIAAVAAATRSEDGRGPKTSLEHSVPAHFGLTTPTELTYAFHVGEIGRRRVLELPPLVFAEAERRRRRRRDRRPADRRGRRARTSCADPPRADQGAGRSAARRRPAEGRRRPRPRRDRRRSREVGPSIEVHPTASAPVVGAALLGLDDLGAAPTRRPARATSSRWRSTAATDRERARRDEPEEAD